MMVRISQVYLGERDVKVPEEALTSDDPEVSFFAALLLRNPPVLIRALDSPNPSKWMVAANKLIALHRADALVDIFARRANPEQQQRLLDQINFEKHPVPELHAALFDTIERHPKTKLSRSASGSIGTFFTRFRFPNVLSRKRFGRLASFWCVRTRFT
jgi:hypothetical protein